MTEDSLLSLFDRILEKSKEAASWKEGEDDSFEEIMFDLSSSVEKLVLFLELSRSVQFVGTHQKYPDIPDADDPEAHLEGIKESLKLAKQNYEDKRFYSSLDNLLKARASIVSVYSKLDLS